MPVLKSHQAQKWLAQANKLPTTTWIGVGGTALLAVIFLLAFGVWPALGMVALVVLITALYGALFRRKTWLRLPRKRTAASIGAAVAFVVLVGSGGTAIATTHPDKGTPNTHAIAAVATTSANAHASAHAKTTHRHTSTPSPTPTRTPTPTATHAPAPVVTTKLVSETAPILFQSTTVTSATLAKGTSTVSRPGANGVETKTYVVTYTNGTETSRVLKSDVTTTPPVTQVTTVGTYVAPAAPTCTNGTYVNSAGATVCRPEVSSNAPAGATAKCSDGTYSFSQSRRGTCSSHGGVATWL